MSEGSHWYTREGEDAFGAGLREARKQDLLPSVTTILRVVPKPQLDKWKMAQVAKAADEYRRQPEEDLEEWIKMVVEKSGEFNRETQDFGIRFHESVDRKCKDLDPNPDPDMADHFSLYEKWHNENIASVLFSEKNVVQPCMGYAGKLDMEVHMRTRDGVGLGDVKTRGVKEGKKPQFYPEQVSQLAAYGFASPLRPDFLFSVIINRDKPEPPYVKIWTQEESDKGMARFLSALDLWKKINSFGLEVEISKTESAI